MTVALVTVADGRHEYHHRSIASALELNPGDFHERADGDVTWTEHRRFFTTNPCVFHAHLCRSGWPQVTHSEGIFTHQLIRDTSLQFAFWGAKYAAPLVTHIGAERTGGGY